MIPKMLPTPKYHEDILKHLRFFDGAPATTLLMEEYLNATMQTLSRAADEIERLRQENAELRHKVTKAF